MHLAWNMKSHHYMYVEISSKECELFSGSSHMFSVLMSLYRATIVLLHWCKFSSESQMFYTTILLSSYNKIVKSTCPSSSTGNWSFPVSSRSSPHLNTSPCSEFEIHHTWKETFSYKNSCYHSNYDFRDKWKIQNVKFHSISEIHVTSYYKCTVENTRLAC